MVLGEVVDKATDVFRDGVFAPMGATAAEPYFNLAAPYIHVLMAVTFIFVWYLTKLGFHHLQQREMRVHQPDDKRRQDRSRRPKRR
jgi:hypothetical protein